MASAPQTSFGRWTLNTKNGCLEINMSSLYQIRLEEMTNSARILDWIFQINEKTWATANDIGELIRAINYIFGRDMASGGIDRPFDAKAILNSRYGCKFP